MRVFLNGQILEEEQAHISIQDRAFLYGDSLFETLLVWRGQPFRWQDHWERLERGAQLLAMPMRWGSEALHRGALELTRQNAMSCGVLRVTVSRGPGPRGYSTRGCHQSTTVMALYPLPAGLETTMAPKPWRLHPSAWRLWAGDPLTRIKSGGKLGHVLARLEAERAGADEALLCNTDGVMAECVSGNLFWIEGQRLHTPPLSAGALPGVTRALLMAHSQELGLTGVETQAGIEILTGADGVMVTMSTLGIVEAIELEGKPLRRSPWAGRLQQWYWNQVTRECGTNGP